MGQTSAQPFVTQVQGLASERSLLAGAWGAGSGSGWEQQSGPEDEDEAEGACELRLGPHQGLCANQALLLLAPIPSAPPPPTSRSPAPWSAWAAGALRPGSSPGLRPHLQDLAWAECRTEEEEARTTGGGEAVPAPPRLLPGSRPGIRVKREEGRETLRGEKHGPCGLVFLLPLLLGSQVNSWGERVLAGKHRGPCK